MNELLGWYGYDKVNSKDTEHLNLERYTTTSGLNDEDEDLSDDDDIIPDDASFDDSIDSSSIKSADLSKGSLSKGYIIIISYYYDVSRIDLGIFDAS